jgi:type I restriction-modification system DNA methylase subunit
MNRQELTKEIALGEDSARQFKADVKNAESLASEMAAFANTNGGTIFIGVADDGSTPGLSQQDVARINQLIGNAASHLVRSSLAVQTENVALENGRIYEYFLTQFAPEGPRRRHENPTERLTFYGLEKNATTIRLAKMNLAVHGLEGDIQTSITYYEDSHELLREADFVMANPPFNVDEIAANDWSLTPGRYVGVAPEEEDEDFDFEEALRDIHVELEDLNAESVQLAVTIKKNFEELGI